MSELDGNTGNGSPLETPNYVPDIDGLLKSLNAARRQASLYGLDHQNTLHIVKELVGPLQEFFSIWGRSTFIFTKCDVIVNDHRFLSRECADLYLRMRVRGVLAFTFVTPPTEEQLLGFLAFLNEEPLEIRKLGGASGYLVRQGVTKIVTTAAVYTRTDDEKEVATRVEWDSDNVDSAIAAAIYWLSEKEDEANEELPRLPIIEILSDPDMAAKLIREAVTKLHAANKNDTDGELASRAFSDLKALAGEPEKWDSALPQIRKAISKLPKELRPAEGLVSSRTRSTRKSDANQPKFIDIVDIETRVSNACMDTPQDTLAGKPFDMEDLRMLFYGEADSLPSSWKAELLPASFIRASGKTFNALMNWERSPSKHSSATLALSTLIPRAVEMGDIELALSLADILAKEATREGDQAWRTMNARSGLSQVGIDMLRDLVEHALESGSYEAKSTAASLVEVLPELAHSMVSMLGVFRNEAFDESLRRGLIRAGQKTVAGLAQVLDQGSVPAKESAVEVLIAMDTASSIGELGSALRSNDVDISLKILLMLPKAHAPFIVDVCKQALYNRSSAVRCAALTALGELKDPFGLPTLMDIASTSILRGARMAEKMSAIRALGQAGGQDQISFLEKFAAGRSLIFRQRSKDVQLAVQTAISDILSRSKNVELKSA